MKRRSSKEIVSLDLRRLISGAIHQFTVLIERDLLLFLGGKSRKIWVKSLRSCLEAVPSLSNREIDDLRSVHFFSFDPVKLVLGVVMKTTIRLYQFFSSTRQMHYECLTDLHVAQPIDYLDFFTLNNGDEHYLCYGSSSTFFSQRLDQQRAASVVVLRDEELLQRERATPPLILRLIALTGVSRERERSFLSLFI